jgi:hypothetical protein
MYRTRLVLLGLLAVFVASMVASATASAAGPPRYEICKNVGAKKGKFENGTCTKEGPPEEYEWTEIAKGEKDAIEGTSTTSKLEGLVAGTTTTIECSEDTFTGSLEEKGKSSGEVKFKNCKFFIVESSSWKKVAPPGCKVKEPIEFKFKDELTEGGPSRFLEDEFKPESGELFVTIEVTECTSKMLDGKFEIKGTQLCALPESEAGMTEHEIVCTPSGGRLKLGNEPAGFFSTEKVKQTSKAFWQDRK